MKKINLMLLFIFIAGFATHTMAQFGFGKVADLEEVKKRKLIVIVETPDQDLVKKLTKKGKTDAISQYQEALDLYNKEMKEVVEKFWTFSSNEIVYKTWQEVDKMKPSWMKYAVIYCTTASTLYEISDGFKNAKGLTWTPSGDKMTSNGITVFAVSLPEKNRCIWFQDMPDIFPTKSDLVYGITSTNYYFNYRMMPSHQKGGLSEMEDMIAENQPILKNRTLLLRQDNLDSKLTPDKIANAYPFKYRTVTSDEMDQYVVNADSNYAYAIIIPTFSSHQVIYIQYVYDCKDGSTLGLARPSIGGMMLGGYIGQSGHSVITEKTLKDFCKYITDKKKK